jgi:pyruvate dehydrogenase E1 component alpha subunit/2-oxoisovalerate dehydrogenase E1 component alpha subunit
MEQQANNNCKSTTTGGTLEIASDLYCQAYRLMLTARILEEKLAALKRSGKIVGGVFLGRGQEALSVALGIHLRKGDIYAPLIRDQAGRLAFGEGMLDALRTYLGSALGSMRGRDGNIHRGRPREGYFAMISHLGAMVSAVSGALIARRFRGETSVVGATCIGDGGTSTGSFHEGLNLAAIEKLPLVVVVANNQYAYSTPNSSQFACHHLVDRAIGYGITGHRVIGNDLADCLKVLQKAVAAARSGGGPQLVVADLLRLIGHADHDDASYITEAQKQSPLGRDCMTIAQNTILEKKWMSQEELDLWQKEIEVEIEATTTRVLREPAPDPEEELWIPFATSHIHSES